MHELTVSLSLGFVVRRGRVVASCTQPSAGSFFADGSSEGFIEIGIAVDEKPLVGQFVKKQLRQFRFAAIDESI